MGGRPPLVAITLWPEWAHAIAYLGKDVENRGWRKPCTYMVGRWIAIHAGTVCGGRKVDPVHGCLLVANTYEAATGQRISLLPWQVTTGAIVAIARVSEVGDIDSPWSVEGQWQIGLSEVTPLARPVPCKGALGFWKPTQEITNQVRTEWRTARMETTR